MKEITLTKGYVAVVDDEDYERINALKWYALVHRRTVYAARRNKSEGAVLLHRFIMGVADGKTHVDHKDFNGLNNTRANLRVCTNQQNHYGMRKMRVECSSKYKGVCWYARYQKWKVSIKRCGRTVSLGYHATEEDAARAYDRAARELFGEFAHCNFPE